MTVKQLLKALAEFPPDAPVIIQQDVEGNGFSPCVGADSGLYDPASPCRGDVYQPDDDEAPGDAVPCVVLWPNG